jgi:hypothetical protein
MPELSRFYGIIIRMYLADWNRLQAGTAPLPIDPLP